jgi:hypothetical protein
MLPSNMLLLNLTPLIDMTFSTPTGHYTQNPPGRHFECNRDFSQTSLIRTSQGDLLPNSSRAAHPYNFPQPLRWLVPCGFPSCVVEISFLFPGVGSDPE